MWQLEWLWDKAKVSQIAKSICFNMQNVFVSNCRMYLSQIKCVAAGVAVGQGQSYSKVVIPNLRCGKEGGESVT